MKVERWRIKDEGWRLGGFGDRLMVKQWEDIGDCRVTFTTEKAVHKILYLIVCFQAQDETQAEKGF